jgi:guanine nucleotide-binding protein subunit alpha
VMAASVETVSLNMMQPIMELWKDSGVQKAFGRSREFQLLDSAEYFLRDIERTFQPDFLPNTQDILRTRLPTCGVVESDFFVSEPKSSVQTHFKMFDVGGQRGERKKWIHCFEKVRAILFIASLSEYDQTLVEDNTKNRLRESLRLFQGIITLPWFKSTAIILFLNKDDLFQQKIKVSDLGSYFPEYVGGVDYEEALFFIKDLYFSQNTDPNKTIYAHVTDATNTNQIEFVWKCTKHIVMQQNLSKAGLVI